MGENECDADAADAIFDTSKHTNYGNDHSQSTLSWWDDCDTEEEEGSDTKNTNYLRKQQHSAIQQRMWSSESSISWWDDNHNEDEDDSADAHNAAPAECMTKEQKNLQRWSPQIRESKKTSTNVAVPTTKKSATSLDTTTHHTVRIDAMLAPPVRRCSVDNELKLLAITKDICDDG